MSDIEQREISSVAQIWERFVAGDEVDLSTIRPVIAESWRRCRDEHHLSPSVTRVPSAPAELSMLDADLKEASVPVVDLLHDAIHGISALVGISNRQGELITVEGDSKVLAAADAINALAGGDWREANGGTNCIGTCVAIGKPIQIILDEHYLPLIKRWNTCSAPILHPINGSLLALSESRA